MSESTASRIGRFGSEAMRDQDGEDPEELDDLVTIENWHWVTKTVPMYLPTHLS